jgi:hypothetical protein
MTKSMPQVRDFCRKHYSSAKGNWDMYIPFIEKGLKVLILNFYRDSAKFIDC